MPSASLRRGHALHREDGDDRQHDQDGERDRRDIAPDQVLRA